MTRRRKPVLLCTEDMVLELDLRSALADAGYAVIRAGGYLPQYVRPVVALIDGDPGRRQTLPLLYRLRQRGVTCVMLYALEDDESGVPPDVERLIKPIQSDELVARVSAIDRAALH